MSVDPSLLDEPWRLACPECDSRAIYGTYRLRDKSVRYDCKRCHTCGIEPIDVKNSPTESETA